MLEEEAASAYERAAQLICGEVIKCLLKFISHDSFNHARFFELMTKVLLPEVSMYSKDRVNVQGKSWLTVVENAARTSKNVKPAQLILVSLLIHYARLKALPLMKRDPLHAKLIGCCADEKIELKSFNAMPTWIIEDEGHEKGLEIVKRTLFNHDNSC